MVVYSKDFLLEYIFHIQYIPVGQPSALAERIVKENTVMYVAI